MLDSDGWVMETRVILVLFFSPRRNDGGYGTAYGERERERLLRGCWNVLRMRNSD